MINYSNSWLNLDKKSLIHNLKSFKKIIGDKVDLMPVVKSNAYGHGLDLVSKILDKQKEVAKLNTVNLNEAIYLRSIGIKKPILVLSFYDLKIIKDYKLLKDVEFVVYDLKQTSDLNKLAGKLKTKIKIHLKIDTGTSRLGILPNQAVSFAKKLLKLKDIQTYGLFTHFASAEEVDQKFTIKQIEIFNDVINNLKKEGIEIPYKHTACSAAILLQNKSHFNAVRLGISLYGLWSLEDHKSEIKRKYPWFSLKPVLSWQTKIIQIKNLPKGTTIGYGRTHRLNHDSRIAILPVGYWDGYDRKLSNQGEVLIKGARCKVMGRVCMNLIMIDITSHKNVKINDQAVLIGRQGQEEITADKLANKVKTINYEIITRINPLLPRIIK